MMIDGFPKDTTIIVDICHGAFDEIQREEGGKFPGGERETFLSTLYMRMKGTGELKDFERGINMRNVNCIVDTGKRELGKPVQTFPNDMAKLQGQIPPGDPDFAELKIVAGVDFGFPSPGQTTLIRQGAPGDPFAVDSFFDIKYQIDFVGAEGSKWLEGMKGSTKGEVRMLAGEKPLFCVDQEQRYAPRSMVRFYTPGLAQSFMPAEPWMSGAEFKTIPNVGGNFTVTIQLWDDLPPNGGEMLAGGTDEDVNAGEWATVEWGCISVTPETTYYLVVFSEEKQEGGLSGDMTNPYPRGQMYAFDYQSFPIYDYTFATFCCEPPPKSACCLPEGEPEGDLLIAASPGAYPAWAQDVADKIKGTGKFPGNIDLFNTATGTPTPEQLAEYAVVMTFTDARSQNADLLGDRLADFVDAGGGVVQAVFSWHTAIPLGGRWRSGGYSPLTYASQAQGVPLTIGTRYEPDHPVLDDVATFNGGSASYHNTGTYAPGAIKIADWSNGKPLVAEMPGENGCIIGLNFYPPSGSVRGDLWDINTDGAHLLANAVVYAMCGDPSCEELTEEECAEKEGVWHEGKTCDEVDCEPPGECDVVEPGEDCFETECGKTRTSFADKCIPADFFCSGGEPFCGEVLLGGGFTTVMRLDAMALPDPGSEADTRIELVGLNLSSCFPIEVQCPGGPQKWNVQVGLGAPVEGAMHVKKTHDNGGVFDATIPGNAIFTFTGPGGERQLEAPFNIAAKNTPWLHESKVSYQCGKCFAPGVKEECCPEECHPDPENPSGHLHCVIPPKCQRGKRCPMGACCFDDGRPCEDRLTVDQCNAKGGEWHEGKTCDEACPEGFIPAGPDCLETIPCRKPREPEWESRHTFDPCIPADFFGPQSEPFCGTVRLAGKTDTRVERLDDMDVPNVGDTDQTRIQLVQLGLVSCKKIKVKYPGRREKWKVELTLDGGQPEGNMEITKTHPNGGVFDATILGNAKFTFRKGQREKSLPGPFSLDANSIPWAHKTDITPGCGGDEDPNFYPMVGELPGDGAPDDCCFQHCHPASGNPDDHWHCVMPPGCKEEEICPPTGRTCVYQARKVKKRGCDISGCPPLDSCEIVTPTPCDVVGDCSPNLGWKKPCNDPAEIGQCKYKRAHGQRDAYLKRCDCR